MEFLQQFATLSDYNSAKGGTLGNPCVSLIKDEMSVAYDPYDPQYFRITAVEPSVVAWRYAGDSGVNPSFQYRKNGVGNFVNWDKANDSISLQSGEYVEMIGNNTNQISRYEPSAGWHSHFNISGGVNLSGKLISLMGTEIIPSSCFNGCFFGSSIINAKDLILPDLNGGNSQFGQMFSNCTSLITTPSLSSISLSSYCFYSMFNGCTSLTQAPELPATTLTSHCYSQMFNGCTSLTQAPELPATTLAERCYECMFQGCNLLTQAPELPATTLANGCYYFMFCDCTSLTQAPDLLATIARNQCYYKMFYGCSSLNYIKCLLTNISWTECTSGWLSYVSQTGTFIKSPDMTSWPTGDSGIPSGWTVQDYVPQS